MTRPVRLPAAKLKPQSKTVFVPMTLAQALECRAGNRLGERVGFMATEELLSGYALTPEQDEDADFAAQNHANLAALLDNADGPRMVVAVRALESKIELLPAVEAKLGLGQVSLSSVGWAKVMALFIDEPAAADAVQKVRSELGALADRQAQLNAAASSATVEELADEHALLWYLPSELDDVERLHA